MCFNWICFLELDIIEHMMASPKESQGRWTGSSGIIIVLIQNMFGLSDPCSDCLSCFGNKKIGVARSCGKSLFALQLVLAALALPRTFSGWSLHKSILALWSLCTCWVCPHQVPFFFWSFFFPSSKDPKGVPGPSGWAPRLPYRGGVVQ